MDFTENQQISIAQILLILKKHLKLILASTVLVTLLAGFVTFFVLTPQYTSTTEILVNRKVQDGTSVAQLQQTQADVQMISTYKDIIKSPTVLRKANSELSGLTGYKSGVNSLNDAISVNSQQNSQVFSISAKSSDPETSAMMANKVATIFKHKVKKIMSIDNVSIVSKATANTQPTSPRTKLNLLAGLIVGLLLGVGLAFLRELSNRTVDSEEFLTEELGLKSLGIINEISDRDIRRRLVPKASNDNVSGKSRMSRRV